MLDILKRFFNLFRGASYRLLHELETVENQSILAIEDFKKNLENLNKATLSVGANLESLKEDRTRAQEKVKQLETRVDRLLDAQDQFQVKGELEKVAEIEEQIIKDADDLSLAQQDLALYESSVLNNQPKYDALVDQIKEQKREKENLEQELKHLKNQYRVAKAELDIAKMLDENTSESIRSRVEDIRTRVKDKSSAARAQQALNQALSTKPSKEVTKAVQTLNAQATIDALREKRKQREASA